MVNSCTIRPFYRLLTVKNISKRHKSSSTIKHEPSQVFSELPQPRLDYRSISENLKAKIHNASIRNAPVLDSDISTVARLYEEAKQISKDLNMKRHEKSLIGERIRVAANEQQRSQAREEATKLKRQVHELEVSLQKIEQDYLQHALPIPNDTHPKTPVGPESNAVTIGVYGPEPLPTNRHRDHVAIAQKLGLLDLESGATVTGSSWYFLKREAALLELALTNYAIATAIQHGFTLVTTPDVVRSDIAVRCGFIPRDSSKNPISHMYHISPSHESSPQLILSGTAEIPLAGMFANKVYTSSSLPRKVVGVGHAFRQEAGARSSDTRGLYRVHQFTKVELFSVTAEDQSESMMEEMMLIQKTVLHGLGLPFRVLDMPTEELGASAFRKYDMEVWMPGRGSWGEVTSLSNCTDYQARRLHIRYRPPTVEDQTPKGQALRLPFAHTLNGTAAAIPRLIVALLENGAILNDDGEVTGLRLPETLRRFWITSLEASNIQWYSV